MLSINTENAFRKDFKNFKDIVIYFEINATKHFQIHHKWRKNEIEAFFQPLEEKDHWKHVF